MKQTIRKRSLILAASVLTFVPFLFGCDTVHLQGEVTVHFYDTNEGGTASGSPTGQSYAQGAPPGSSAGDFWNQAKVIQSPLNGEYEDRSRIIATGEVFSDTGSVNIYESSDPNSAVLGSIPSGAHVGVLSDGDWLFVKYYEDKSSPLYYGYIYSQCFTSSGSC